MSSPPLRGTAEWSANREVWRCCCGADGRKNRYAAQQLWLRKEHIKAEASQVASAGSPQASQQPAGCRAKPAPARAQAVPKQKTAAQLAKLARNSRRLNQKHLASKMWACECVWRAGCSPGACERALAASRTEPTCPRRVRRVRGLSRGLREAAAATVGYYDGDWEELLRPASGLLRRSPILVGRLIVQQWPSRRAAAGPPPAPAPLALAAPPPATQLAPSTPPSQQPPSRPVWNGGPLAAAAAPPAPAASRPNASETCPRCPPLPRPRPYP